jgi:Flp pilus assembly protein CpaB
MINSEETVAVQAPEVITKEAPTVQILVATIDIGVGKKLDFTDLSWRSWPESLLNPQYITQNEKPDYINNLIGGVARIPMLAGEPIIEGKIIQRGDRGAMALLLRRGMRAISVPITVTTGAGGFILPGDYVDVIFTTNIIRDNLFTTTYTTAGTNVTDPVLKSYLELRTLSKTRKNNEEKNIPDNKEKAVIDDSKKAVTDDDKKNNTVPLGNKTVLIDKNNAINENNIEKDETKIREDILKRETSENKLMQKIANEEELLIANGSQVSELMLENVKVLAIDQKLDKAANTQSQEQQQQPEASSIIGATATLEVTPEQAKLLAWSASSGQLTLSLRSVSENLSEKDTDELSQKIPLTKTSFAWPIDKILSGIAGNEGIQENKPGLELIRNGNISLLRNSEKKKAYSDNSGAPNVQR